jgi:hypothetical protein
MLLALDTSIRFNLSFTSRLHDVGPFDTSVGVLEEARLHNRSERALWRLVHGRLRNLK